MLSTLLARTGVRRIPILLLAAILVPVAQAAETFPNRPIRIVVPVSAGGNLDVVTRAVADRLATAVGQPVVVENRIGGSSTVGTRFVAKSAPDGYTLLAIGNTFLSAPAVVADAGYDPVADFVGVTLMCKLPNALVVAANSPVKSVAELIERAKARPGQLTFGTAGGGSVGHMAAERFSRDAGIKLLHVPYKGNAPALVDVMGGRVDMMFDPLASSAPHLRGGTLRALAVTSLVRTPLFPGVPAMDEAGVKGFEDVTVNAIMAPAGTPREVVGRLHAELVKVLQGAELKARFASQGLEMAPSASPEAFGAYVKSEVARYAKLVRDANIKAE